MACFNPNDIPYEIAISIFQCVLEDLNYKQAKYNLLNFELVCKSWRKPAQKLLFRDIQLTPANSASFIQCIQHDIPQQVALAVKSLLLVGNFIPMYTVADVIKPIFKHCPNIEELRAINTDVERQLWNYLLLTDEPLKLTRIMEHEMEDQIYYSLYLTVAHKFKQHLHQLCLQFDGGDDSYYASLLVGGQLHKFTSLRHLSIRTLCFFKAMETMLDNCPQTTKKLTMNAIDVRDLAETRQSWSNPNFNTIARNESIQELSCFLLIFTSTLLKYFAYKLKALKRIDLRTFDTNEARSQIMRVCDAMESYKLALLFRRIPIMPEAAIQEWVRHVLDQSRDHRIERFCLDLDFISGVMVAISPWILQISRTMETSEIVLNYVKMNKLAEVVSDEIEPTYLGLLLHQCKPRLIQVKGIDNITQHRRWMKEGRSDLFAYSGERSWRFFDAAISQQENADIQINDIHLSLSDTYYPPRMQGQAQNGRVSKLQFYNSILHSASFTLISQRLHVLGTLSIDTCHLIRHPHPFTLKISLPATDIGLLSLKAASLDAYSDPSNIQLLHATSESGCYTLVIETETKTYVSHVEGNSKLSSESHDDNDSIPVQGTKDLYLVWIECKELKEFSLSNDTRTLYVQLEATIS